MVISTVVFSLFVLCAVSSPVDQEVQFSPDEFVEPEYLDKLLAEKRYDEFNKLMDIDIPHLSHPRHENSTSDPMFNEGVLFGDILLTARQKEEARQGIKFEKYAGSKWTPCIPYAISADFSAAHKNMIQSGIAMWNKDLETCIKYTPWVNEKPYVYFMPGNGCYSNLGKTGKQQPLSLSPSGCMRMGTILHEMSHASGLTHEQNRPDRDEYVTILPENIPAGWQSQYDKASSEDFGIYGPYDYYSCMHYPISAPETGKPAFKVLKSGIDEKRIGQRVNCTSTDIEKIKNHYGCK